MLGAALLTGDVHIVGRLVERGLRPEHFYYRQHRAAFEAMVSLAEREAGVDLITVSSEMETLGLQYGLGQGVGGLHAGQQR